VASDNPPLKVRISKPFYLGVYEVSQAEFQQVMNANPSSFRGAKAPAGVSAADLPVEQVTHSAAVAFCDKLTELHGKALGLKFRLPYEVEWEYACRAGSDQPFCFGTTLTPEQAVFNARAPRPVRLAGAPNGFHLVGMHGNVAEWCADRYHAETYRNARPEEDGFVVDLRGPKTGTLAVLRGGSWSDKLIPNQPAASNLSAATRMSGVMESRLDRWGFRVAAEIVESNGAALEPSADR
jgi:formylglycine-generating enzyme required for sulfatase activity